MSLSEFNPPSELERRARAQVGSTLVGKWRLTAVLGVGGMASVFAATHRNGHRVAIKLLHPELATAPEIRERFLREGYVANGIEHPGALRIVDDDITVDGLPFLVMDLLEGETLEERLQRQGGIVPRRDLLVIADGVLDVLVAAHFRGVIHRDLKPANLFLCSDGQIRVLDFGIARMTELSVASGATRMGTLMGSPRYMPPEQASGLVDQIDHRSDLWSVGATMFRCLSGKHVHDAPTENQVLAKAMMEAAPPLSSVAPQIPGDVCALVDRALRFRKEERWPDAATMRKEVQRALHATSSETTMIIGAAAPRVAGSPSRHTELLDVRQIPSARGSDQGEGRTVVLDTSAPPSRRSAAGASPVRSQQTTERLDIRHLAPAATRREPTPSRVETPMVAGAAGSVPTQELAPTRYETSVSVVGPSPSHRRETLHVAAGVLVVAASALLLGILLLGRGDEPALTTVIAGKPPGMSDPPSTDGADLQVPMEAPGASAIPTTAGIDIANLPEVQPTASSVAIEPGPASMGASAPPARTAPTSLVASTPSPSASAEPAQPSKLFDDAGVSSCIRSVGTRAKSCGADEDVGVVVAVTLTYRPAGGAPSVAILPSTLHGASRECIRQVFKSCATPAFDDRPFERKLANFSLQ